jgi:hypothetical protein
MQRLFGGTPQSRDPLRSERHDGPRISSASRREALRAAQHPGNALKLFIVIAKSGATKQSSFHFARPRDGLLPPSLCEPRRTQSLTLAMTE